MRTGAGRTTLKVNVGDVTVASLAAARTRQKYVAGASGSSMSDVCPLAACGTFLLTTRVAKAASGATSNVSLSDTPPVVTAFPASSFTGWVLYASCAPFAGEMGVAEATETLGLVGELHAVMQTNREAPPQRTVIIRAGCMSYHTTCGDPTTTRWTPDSICSDSMSQLGKCTPSENFQLSPTP